MNVTLYAFESNQCSTGDPVWAHEDFSPAYLDAEGDMLPIYHRTREGAMAVMVAHHDYRLSPHTLRVIETEPDGEFAVVE